MAELDPTAEHHQALFELADAFNIATDFWDWQGEHKVVSPVTIVKVLRGLGVDASTPAAAWHALAEKHQEPWTRMLPEFLALRQHRTGSIWVHVAHGDPVEVWIDLEAGGRRDNIHQHENWTPPRDIGGRWVGEASFEVPSDLPLGYHTLRARSNDTESSMPLIITPEWLGFPEQLEGRRAWGIATQLYSVRSAESWGVGDLADLEDLAVWSAAEHACDFILVNPMHAAQPVPPMEPSPYLPTSRRFANPLYLRVERIPEYAVATAEERSKISKYRDKFFRGFDPAAPIDRDRCWKRKRKALSVVFEVPRSPGRQAAFDAYRRREGRGLADFATWAVLARHHGPRFTDWPPELQHLDSPDVARFRIEHVREIDFECWLQWVLDEQLASTQQAARRAGMRLGIMHDLAVGVHSRGADAWSQQDIYANGTTVGCPPDPFNQNGQDWNQPPWRPDRLAKSAYAPFREMVRTILRHAGGIRVDHVIGLFRLWWIPNGSRPTEGTYVRYDHEAMVGILALEAHRAEAVVVGEDLGTVEPWVRDYLRERGILGTSILWFEFEWDAGGAPLRPEWWREYCLASVSSHDLPTTAAYLDGDHVRLKQELGVLTRSLEEELEVDARDREAWLDNLRARGALAKDADVEETIRALHRYLTWTPSRLLCLSLADAVGDRRAQNQPGTIDEYPNWRVPLTGDDGSPVRLEDVFTSERAASLFEVFRTG